MNLTARLTVDEDALAANWRALDALSDPACETGAVVKGDGYGCGAGRVGKVLAAAGARTFFVAVPDEGIALRKALGHGPVIYTLGGYGRERSEAYRRDDLRPVLNSAEQFRAWFADNGGLCAVQLDTGMNRLGMEAVELASLGEMPKSVVLVMSHMGCADDPGHPMNAAQLAEFNRVAPMGGPLLSLSATAGLLLGSDYHFDLVRPGIGLYGGWPFEEARLVVTVEAPIIQIREMSPGESVGYAATWTAERPTRLATLSSGYADGLIRAMGASAQGFISGQPVPFAGRVSMDLITLDVTDCPCEPGDWVELMGPNQSIDDIAAAAGTIGHEILTSLGRRYERR